MAASQAMGEAEVRHDGENVKGKIGWVNGDIFKAHGEPVGQH
jgi:hypothetical protein